MPNLQLPDVYSNNQKPKELANLGLVPNTVGHNTLARRKFDPDLLQTSPGAARRNVQQSQALVQHKFNQLNIRLEPAGTSATKAVADHSYANDVTTGSNGRFKSSAHKAYKNHQSSGLEESRGFDASSPQDNYATLKANALSTKKLPSLPA